jgi:hypothetical protein
MLFLTSLVLSFNLIVAFQQYSINRSVTKTRKDCLEMNLHNKNYFKKMAAGCFLVFSLNQDISAVSIPSSLEASISSLEKSENRGEVVQSMADLFEAAGSKTLLARTRYKYVKRKIYYVFISNYNNIIVEYIHQNV